MIMLTKDLYMFKNVLIKKGHVLNLVPSTCNYHVSDYEVIVVPPFPGWHCNFCDMNHWIINKRNVCSISMREFL